MMQIVIQVIEKELAVCKIASLSEVDFDGFLFLSKTDDELSLVCDINRIPTDVAECEKGFVALKVQGVLDFSLIGIISGITSVLAENGVSVFVVSTYDTDYVLVKRECLEKATEALALAGYKIGG